MTTIKPAIKLFTDREDDSTGIHNNDLILVHNGNNHHQTGNPTPSSEDITITRRLKEVGEIISIKVLDHIIIGDGGYLSFVERGLL